VTGFSGAQTVLCWRCQPIEYRYLGCPKRGIVASQMDMVAYPTFDLGRMAAVRMYIDMA
jgi:hypothetical protein